MRLFLLLMIGNHGENYIGLDTKNHEKENEINPKLTGIFFIQNIENFVMKFKTTYHSKYYLLKMPKLMISLAFLL